MEDSVEEIRRLQGCINDLIGVLALPPLWSGRGSTQILSTLLEGLLGMLTLDFACARSSDGADSAPIEEVRLAAHGSYGTTPEEISRALDPWLSGFTPGLPARVPSPLRKGEVSIASFQLGFEDELGTVVVGSVRPGFPTEMERLVLRVAINQAAIGLQEARRLSDQRRAAEVLEQRVDERTSQLTTLNEKLQVEIAERRRAEETLQSQADLLELAHDAIIVRDLDDRIIYWSRGAEEVYGWAREHALGAIAPNFLGTAGFERVKSEVICEGRWEGELLEVKRDGSQIVVASRWALQRDEQGRPVAILQINTDITERKRAAEERAKLASLVENSTDFIGIASLESQVLFVNSAGRKMVGLDGDEEVRATRIFDYVMEQDRARFEREVLPAAMRDSQWEGETRFRHFKTGAAIPMLQHIFSLKEQETGRSVAIGTISRNITGRKRAEAELIALKDELGADVMAMTRLHELSTRLLAVVDLHPLLEEVLDATIALQNADLGNIQLYNPRTHALEIVAQRGFNQDFLDHFSSVAEDSAACGRALQAGERVIIEDVETDPGFEPHRKIAALAGFRAVQSTPLFSRTREPLGMISTHFRRPHRPSERDLRLTDLYARQAVEMIEHQRAEAALRKAHAELAHANRVLTLGEMTASIGHEINQPLTAVATNANACLRWLSGDSPNMDEARAALKGIVRDTDRAGEVIKQIRALAKRAPTETEPLSVNDIIREVIPLATGELVRNQVSLRTELAADLPKVLGDRIQLQQVVLNLVLNGNEAMMGIQGRPRNLLVTTERNDSGEVAVAVQDSGVGLKMEDADRVFGAFFTTKEGGLGLGLSISRTIVEDHGGRLWATPNDGNGATFQFTIPVGFKAQTAH